MGSHSGGKGIPKAIALLLALLAAIALIPTFGIAQRAPKKLAKQDVIDLLTGDVPSDQVAEEARKAGISFQVTASVAKEIRDAGGSEDLINVLRTLAPRAPAAPASAPRTAPASSPPVLVIESSPGQSQVYIDDEPKGSTSPEGRLKLTQLAPGDHLVRISLTGFQDHEETVTLAAGKVTTVATTLQPPVAPPVSSPPQLPQTEETPTVPAPQPSLPPTLSRMPHNGFVSFRVAHDHNRNGKDYCVGVMSVGNGMIYYKADNGVHVFEIPLNSVREARRNITYLVKLGAFHIRLKKGTNFNFVAINRQTQPQPPDPVLTAIDNARGN
jgi:hypothetical protein